MAVLPMAPPLARERPTMPLQHRDYLSHLHRHAVQRAQGAEVRPLWPFVREISEIAAIDAVINALDELRAERNLTKAELAREIGKNEASIRRLLTAPVNPELRTVVALADALDADIRILPRKRTAARRKTQVA